MSVKADWAGKDVPCKVGHLVLAGQIRVLGQGCDGLLQEETFKSCCWRGGRSVTRHPPNNTRLADQ
jgi:hypothetical protein